MDTRRLLSEMPDQLASVLDEKGLNGEKVVIFAEADMDFSCEFRDHVLVLTEGHLIHGISPDITNERMQFGTDNKTVRDYSEYSFYKTDLRQISSPGIDTLVVGGIFRAVFDGKELPVCAFTNAYKGRMIKLCELLTSLINNEEIREDRLYEEIRDEVCPKCGRPYRNKARKVCPKCMDRRKIFFRLASFFRPYVGLIAVICILSVLGAAISAIWPKFSGELLYDGILAKDKSVSVLSFLPTDNFAVMLLILSLTMAGSKLLQQLFGIIQGRIVARIVPNVVCTIKKRVFGAIQSLSVSFFTNRQTGGLMTRITSDAGQVSDLFIDGIPNILPNLFTVVFSLAIMFSSNWILALAAVVSFPPAIFLSIKFRPILWHFNSRQFQTSRNMRAKLRDNFTGARVVKAFGMEDRESVRLEKVNEEAYQAQSEAAAFDVKYSAMYNITVSLSGLLTWFIGAFFVLKVFQPEMTYGTLITFSGYVSLLSGPADFFSYIFRWWTTSMNAAERIFEILDAQADVAESPSPVHIKEIKGDIRLENVSFGYEENRIVLKDISLHVYPGETLGIVGKSGAGKSTLANLITRLYDPTSGNIYIDGCNIRDMAFADVRRAVAMVSQETYIFKGSIYDNIAYAKPDADRETVLNAATAAGAHDFICRLPDGYDTVVGSGGRSLSGGERQRISIARAILADPKILILDEATAAVDTETERNIQAALEKLTKNRTTLSIAHRISTLRDADELIVIEDGQIKEQGTHGELIRKKGTYFRLFQIQNEALAMRGIGD